MAFPDSASAYRTRAAPILRWGILGPGWIAERFVPSLKKNTRQEIVAVGGRDPAEDAGIRRSLEHRQGHPGCRGAGRRSDGRRRLCRDAAPSAFPVCAGRDRGRQARAGREAAGAERGRGAESSPKPRCARRVLPNGSLLDRFPAEVRRAAAVARGRGARRDPLHPCRSRRAFRARAPDHARLTWRAARCSISGPIRWRSRPRSWAPPEQVLAIGQLAPSGVNGQASILLSHAGDAQSVLHTTLFSHTPCEAIVAGSLATLRIPGLFYAPGDFTLTS